MSSVSAAHALDAACLRRYRERIEADLVGNILPFWIRHVAQPVARGFVGALSDDLVIDSTAERGALLTSRILWTYAAAYRRYGDPAYLAMAERAYLDLTTVFGDPEHGGFFWSVDANGAVQRDRKQVYGQAFAIYALSEFHRATGRDRALGEALATFALLERHARDETYGGYGEAYGRAWQPIDDVRLSEIDLNAPKSQNTMLHVMEAYTNLLQVSPDAAVRRSLRALVETMFTRIVDASTGHLGLFFSRDWVPQTERVSYGHDIEAAWLLCAAAEAVDEIDLLARAQGLAVKLAETTWREGTDADGGIFNEGTPDGATDTAKEWWPQAEALVGFLNAAEISGDGRFAEAALRTWDFIDAHLIDRRRGEWLRGVDRAGRPLEGRLKVSFWKCPYHNGRAALEAMRRLDRLATLPPPAEPAPAAREAYAAKTGAGRRLGPSEGNN